MASFSASGGGGKIPQFMGPSNKVRSQGGFGAAAGMTDLAGSFGANREKAPKYDRISGTALVERAKTEAAARTAEANTHAAGLMGLGMVNSAKITADATVKAAQAKAAGASQGAMFKGLGSILGAGLGLLGSDATIKENIERIDDALAKLRDLKPVTFHYTEEYSSSPERMHHGFIAQDYVKVMPDATYYDESTGKLCIDTVDLIGLLVRGIQQLEARVARLEAQKALAGVN